MLGLRRLCGLIERWTKGAEGRLIGEEVTPRGSSVSAVMLLGPQKSDIVLLCS
jgi:hypothetical protein